MNDNFESKFNSRSTPKKQQIYNEFMEKKISIDAIYSDLQTTKNETTIALTNSNLKIEKFEEKIKRYDSDLQNINLSSKLTMEDVLKRLTIIETKLENVCQLKNNFETLRTKVNELVIEVNVMKSTEAESKNSFQDIISKINESFNGINLSLDQNFGAIDKMINENFTQSNKLIDQLSSETQINSILDSKPKINNAQPSDKPLAIETAVIGSQADNSKLSLFCKPNQTSQPLKDLKPKGDSNENENEKNSFLTNISKSNNASILNVSQENLKQTDKLAINKLEEVNKNSFFGFKASHDNQKTTEKPSIPVKAEEGGKNSIFGIQTNPVKTDEGSKNSIFGIQTNPDAHKSIFANPNQSNLFPKTTPNKSELASTQAGIFSNLKMTMAPRSNEPLFGSSNQQPGKLFGDLQDFNKPITNLFPGKALDSTDSAPANIFGKPNSSTSSLFKIDPTDKKPEVTSNVFGANSNVQTFSFLSETKTVGFGDSTEASWKGGSKLFGKNRSMTEESQHDESVEEEHDPHFQPIIELPPLVHVTNDDESHDILFRSRCKLYRFINNEWKERGVGDMKIMQSKPEFNPAKPVILLMRREQIRKICCNQRVSKESPIFAAMPNATNKSTCWVATDYSEDEPKQEKFAVKFSSEDILKEFQTVIARVQKELGSDDSTN